MNETGYHGVGLVILMLPVAGVSEGIVPGEKTAWVTAAYDATGEAALAQKVAEYSLSNAELLASAEQWRPPLSWYEEDHEGLY